MDALRTGCAWIAVFWGAISFAPGASAQDAGQKLLKPNSWIAPSVTWPDGSQVDFMGANPAGDRANAAMPKFVPWFSVDSANASTPFRGDTQVGMPFNPLQGGNLAFAPWTAAPGGANAAELGQFAAVLPAMGMPMPAPVHPHTAHERSSGPPFFSGDFVSGTVAERNAVFQAAEENTAQLHLQRARGFAMGGQWGVARAYYRLAARLGSPEIRQQALLELGALGF